MNAYKVQSREPGGQWVDRSAEVWDQPTEFTKVAAMAMAAIVDKIIKNEPGVEVRVHARQI